MKIFKGIVLWLLVTVIFYFISALVLFITKTLFNDEFKNLWSTAIPVTIYAELILLAQWIYRNKVKLKYRGKNEKL